MVLPYYHRLSRRKQALYRRSVGLTPPVFPDLGDLRRRGTAVKDALVAESPRRTRSAAQKLVDAMCEQLEVPRVKVRVRSRRPDNDEEELHGLYEREDGETPIITVWMRTCAKEQVVKFRTFMRTLLHELVHHLDYDYYGLDDSLHTEGFFKRESALLALVAPRASASEKRSRKKKAPPRTAAIKEARAKRDAKPLRKRNGSRIETDGPQQLSLF